MNHRLSVIMVTLNAQELLQRSLNSLRTIADETIVVDAGSTDNTLSILNNNNIQPVKVKVNHLGKNKSKALSLASCDLVLLLDSDEILSQRLIKEIKSIKRTKIISDGYMIPFRNHLLGNRVRYGGENYAMLRLGRRKILKMKKTLVHEALTLNSKKIAKLRSPILHYSYRSLSQVYKKFTFYALWDAQEKFRKGERSSVKKIIFYPIHMFWARFIKDNGFKDGIFRVPLDIGFAYMEFLTYTVLALKNRGI